MPSWLASVLRFEVGETPILRTTLRGGGKSNSLGRHSRLQFYESLLLGVGENTILPVTPRSVSDPTLRFTLHVEKFRILLVIPNALFNCKGLVLKRLLERRPTLRVITTRGRRIFHSACVFIAYRDGGDDPHSPRNCFSRWRRLQWYASPLDVEVEEAPILTVTSIRPKT